MILFGDSRLEARFWAKVEIVPGFACWRWRACANLKGYGFFRVDGRNVYAHRYAYEKLVGPIPDGLQLDHFRFDGPGSPCMGPRCVLPELHTRPVTRRENVLRSASFAAVLAARMTCGMGHPFDLENAERRRCSICHEESVRRYHERHPTARREAGRRWREKQRRSA